jgi:hypothetical protein
MWWGNQEGRKGRDSREEDEFISVEEPRKEGKSFCCLYIDAFLLTPPSYLTLH